MRRELIEKELTRSVIGAFFEVYNNLRFGFLEHIYVRAMERELRARGHRVEIKSTLILHASAPRQVYNYLRATDLEVGLLLRFGPEPKFYRQVLSNNEKQLPVPDPLNLS